MLKNNILPKKTKIISILMLISFIIYVCVGRLLQIKSYAAQTTESYSSSKISKYPGYKELIDNLKSKYPNWKFKILYTGLDWNQVIKNETSASHGRNIVVSSKTGSWVCNTCGDKLYDTGRWKCASEIAVSYYMDPRNWLNEDYIFQFENLSYDSNTQKIEGVNKIISDAPWMQGSSITYTKTDGTTATINKSYAQIIIEASKQANMSPYHLASRIRQEQGAGKTASSTAKGTYEGYEGYYNYCNIGASGSSESAVIVNALNYAKNKKWTDPETAIKGAASYIAQSYISVGQSTVYLQKFDVDNSDGKLYYHQYMQNVSAAVSESLTVKKSYSDMKMLNSSFTFLIPVYENMPKDISASPDSSTIVTQSVKVTGNDIQVRNSPSLIGTVITKLSKDDVVLRIECAASEVSGYYWDKIVLPSGEKGYIVRNYLTQIKDVTNTNISAVANTSVNLRNGPGTYGTAVVTTLISGQSVTIIEKGVYNNLNENNWVRVKLSNGTQGYIAEQYLTEVGNNQNNNNNNTNNYIIATINCDNGSKVRIRSEASTSSSIVTSLPKGTTVTVMQENVANANGYTWDKIVTSEGLEGFVANKYLNKGTSNNNTGNNTNINGGDSNCKISQSNLLAVPSATVASIKKAYPSYNVLVKNTSGKEVGNDTKIGTGYTVTVDGNTYTIVKKGDVNGDGEVKSTDYMRIKNYIMSTSSLTDAQKLAADANGDGTVKSTDYMRIKNYIMGTSSITIN